jgi:N-acetylglucosaminyldiphosphoundecaprenol N-acetyl-beta-D-mannosaminyltransferase
VTTDRATLLGCDIDRLDMDETLERCREYLDNGHFAQHMSINAAKLVSLRADERMRRIVAGCDLVSADGQSIVWASRLLGDPLPTRVAGIDLMERLLGLAEIHGYRVYILGAREEVLRTAVAKIEERYPKLELAGYRNGYFAEHEAGQIADEIRASRADLLFIAMTSPRKEYFLAACGARSGARLAMGVGGSIDVMAGLTRRAPRAWQRLGLEWLYRLLQEPRRLARRYAVTNLRFASMVVREWWQRRLRSAG